MLINYSVSARPKSKNGILSPTFFLKMELSNFIFSLETLIKSLKLKKQIVNLNLVHIITTCKYFQNIHKLVLSLKIL